MPLSKRENKERMRRVRALKREGGTVLLPSATVRRLRKQGLNITRALTRPAATLDDYRDLQRRLEAKAWRVEQQRSDNGTLRDQIATLEARLATLPAMEDTETKKRVTMLEAELAALQASLPYVPIPTPSRDHRAEAILDDHPVLGTGRRELREEEP